jgi:putative membrane protein
MRERPRLGSEAEFRFKLDAEQPESTMPAIPPAPPPRRRRRYARWFWGALALFVAGAALLDAVWFVQGLFERHVALGAVFAALLAVAAVAAIAWSVAEARAWARLRSVERVRALVAADAAPSRLIEALSDSVAHRPELAAEVKRFREAAAGVNDPHKVAELFAVLVLRPLDRAAYAAVARATRDSGIVTALAPTALLDSLVVIWRTLRLLREIAEIYGFRAGLAGTVFLFRRLASGAALVAATEIAGHLAVQQLGGALAEMVAAKLGGAAVGATRTARIGLIGMQLCRAIPFGAEDLPTFRKLAETVLSRNS